MNTDFTSTRVNSKTAQVAICATKDKVMYFARENKGHKGVKGAPVKDYQGILIHDHEKTYYHCGSNHQECLAHVLRYLKGSIQNEPERKWNQVMWELLREISIIGTQKIRERIWKPKKYVILKVVLRDPFKSTERI